MKIACFNSELLGVILRKNCVIDTQGANVVERLENEHTYMLFPLVQVMILQMYCACTDPGYLATLVMNVGAYHFCTHALCLLSGNQQLHKSWVLHHVVC